MITVNGVELEFSFFNPEHVQKYEAARKQVSEKYAKVQSAGAQSDELGPYIQLLQEGCAAVFEMFDVIFGEGTALSIFGAETDFEKCVEAYLALEDGIAAQADRLGKKISKYQPVRAKR